MHINSIGFRGLRKLGLNHDLHNSDFKIADIEQLQASAINVVVGTNDGGKSTIMDLIRAMSDANVLSTIARENNTTATSSGFVVRFDNDAQVIAMFNKMGTEEFGLAIVSSSAAGQKKFHGRLAKDASIPVPGQLRETINHLSAEVGYRCRHDEVGIPTQAFIDVLNDDAKLWWSHTSSPVLDLFYLASIGFFVFGPQMIIGLAAAECVDKRAAAAANGFAGFFGYVGAAVAGYPIGKIIDMWSWDGYYMCIIFSSVIILVILLPLWSLSQSKKVAEDPSSKNVLAT